MKSSELPDNAELLTVKPGQYWRISRDIETEEGKHMSSDVSASLVVNCSTLYYALNIVSLNFTEDGVNQHVHQVNL